MGVRWHMDGRVVVITCEGTYAPHELQDCWVRAEAHETYPERPELLLDMRASASLATRPPGDLRALTEWFAQRAERVGNRCGLLARPGVQYGLMRMASTWLSMRGCEARVFRKPDRALAWLQDPSAR